MRSLSSVLAVRKMIGHVFEFRIGAENAADLDAVEIGHHDVENDEVRQK